MQHPQLPMKAEDGVVHPAMSASRHPINIAHIGKVNEGKLGHCYFQIKPLGGRNRPAPNLEVA
jgi:hypothetical protein